jgi:hypothetical protein
MTSQHNHFVDKPNFIEVLSFEGKKVYNSVLHRGIKTPAEIGIWIIKYKN